MGEIYSRGLPQNAMGHTAGERFGGQCRVMPLAEEHVSSRQAGTGKAGARELSVGNKDKRGSVRFTFLLADNRKMGGKVLYKVKHLCVCYLYVWTEGHLGDLCRSCFFLFVTFCM